jgi:hypothetical protein
VIVLPTFWRSNFLHLHNEVTTRWALPIITVQVAVRLETALSSSSQLEVGPKFEPEMGQISGQIRQQVGQKKGRINVQHRNLVERIAELRGK